MMSWEQKTFINELSNGAIEDFLRTSVDEEWIIKTYGSVEKAVEVSSNICADNSIVDECVDEILSIVLTCVLDR
jgi:hypothetical protein